MGKALALVGTVALAIGLFVWLDPLASLGARAVPGDSQDSVRRVISPGAEAEPDPSRTPDALDPFPAVPVSAERIIENDPGSGAERRSVAPDDLVPGSSAAARLRGTIVSEEGPVAGAELTLQCFGIPDAQATSDPRGNFTLALSRLSERPGALAVRAPGYALLEMGIGRLDRGEDRNLGTLSLVRGALVEGRVVSADGAPVEGAAVSVSSVRIRQRSRVLQVRSEADGRYKIEDAPIGRVRLEAVAPGHGGRAFEILAPATNAKIRLSEPHALTVRVKDEQGAAIQGAEVRLDPSDPLALSEQLLTDGEGRAVFADLGGPIWNVSVSAAEFRPLNRPEVLALAELELQLIRWPCLLGRVLQSDGSPAPRGTRAWAAHRTRVTGRMPPAGDGQLLAPDGSFRLCNVFPGAYEVIVEAPGFSRTRSGEVPVPLEGSVDVGTIVLTRGGGLVLSLDAPGRELAGAVVELHTAEPHPGAIWNADERSPFRVARSTPDASGQVRFEGVEPGAVWVLVRTQAYLPFVGGPYAIRRDALLRPPPIRLETGGYVAGRVVNGEGGAVPTVALILRGNTVDGALRASADVQGIFEFPAVPAGTYRLWARSTSPQTGSRTTEIDVEVVVGEVSTTEIVL